MTDAFLIEFLKGPVMELEDAHVFGILREFREWREARIARLPDFHSDKPG